MTITWSLEGLDEANAAFDALPIDLTDDARTNIASEAANAVAAIRARYPRVTGGLIEGVGTQPMSQGPYYAGSRVVSLSGHANAYEYGSQVRHTALGYNRGIMPRPPQPVFVPTLIAARAAIMATIATDLVQQGLTVTG
jgi:hypothetical protein